MSKRDLPIVHSSLQKRHQVCSARVRRHTVFDNLAPLAEHFADILVPPRPQIPCGFFRRQHLVINAANLTTRQPLHVSIGVSSPPGISVTSPLHTPREVLFEM